MGLIDVASSNSTWKGLDYYKNNKVLESKKISDTEFEGIINGSNNRKYNVFMDIKHPKKSKCDCHMLKIEELFVNISSHFILLSFLRK